MKHFTALIVLGFFYLPLAHAEPVTLTCAYDHDTGEQTIEFELDFDLEARRITQTPIHYEYTISQVSGNYILSYLESTKIPNSVVAGIFGLNRKSGNFVQQTTVPFYGIAPEGFTSTTLTGRCTRSF